jgi:hypothetical protein
MINKIDKVKIITHFCKEDKECVEDYHSIEMVVEYTYITDKSVLTKVTRHLNFQDYYHDKGDDKIGGAIRVLKLLFGAFPIETQDVADKTI